MFITAADEHNADKQHDQRLNGIGISGSIGATKQSVRKNERHNSHYQPGCRGYISHLQQTEQSISNRYGDENDKTYQRQRNNCKKQAQTLRLITGTYPLRDGKGFNPVANVSEGARKQTQAGNDAHTGRKSEAEQGRKPIMIDEARVHDKSGYTRQLRSQRKTDPTGCNITVADGKTCEVFGAAHTSDGQGERDNNINNQRGPD